MAKYIVCFKFTHVAELVVEAPNPDAVFDNAEKLEEFALARLALGPIEHCDLAAVIAQNDDFGDEAAYTIAEEEEQPC